MDAPNERPVREASVDDGSVEAGGEAPASIGAYLSRQRRLRGISLDDLAALTQIPLRSLARLEAGTFDADPDGFVRGFVRTVATALGLDPGETVTRMLSEPGAAADPRPDGLVTARHVAVVLVLFSIFLVAAVLPVWLHSRVESEPRASESQAVTRRDPVRALAEAEASRKRPAATFDEPGPRP